MARPTKLTTSAVSKLEEAFLLGCTDLEACLYAGFSCSALYRHQEKYPEFRERKEVLKSNISMKARKVIYDALERGDTATAQKVLDRKEGTKIAVGAAC